LFELGHEYRRVANEAGVEQYEVMTGLNDSPTFIDAMAELVFQKLGVSETRGAAA
jgi:protoheme ferro-lyase